MRAVAIGWVKTPGRAWTGLTVYDSSPALGFAADAAAVEITLANGGRGPRGPADAFGRCSSRYHDLACAHSQSVDWLASGPHPVTGAASLSNLADRLELDMSARTIWGDPDGDEPGYPVPARTIELAARLSRSLGLADAPPWTPPAQSAEKLFGASYGGTRDSYSDLAREIGPFCSLVTKRK